MGNRVGNRVGNRWGTAGEPLGNRQFRIVMHGAVASSQARWPDGKHVGSKSRDAPQKVTDLFYLVQSSRLSARLSRRSPTINCFDDSLDYSRRPPDNRFGSIDSIQLQKKCDSIWFMVRRGLTRVRCSAERGGCDM